jgi:antitoxin component HigA of HigAB toxin-antitoxin module
MARAGEVPDTAAVVRAIMDEYRRAETALAEHLEAVA